MPGGTAYFAFTASGQSSIKRLTGWSIAENAAAVARVLLRDGGASGAILADIRIAAGDSKSQNLANAVSATQAAGIYVEVAAGTVRGAIYGS